MSNTLLSKFPVLFALDLLVWLLCGLRTPNKQTERADCLDLLNSRSCTIVSGQLFGESDSLGLPEHLDSVNRAVCSFGLLVWSATGFARIRSTGAPIR